TLGACTTRDRGESVDPAGRYRFFPETADLGWADRFWEKILRFPLYVGRCFYIWLRLLGICAVSLQANGRRVAAQRARPNQQPSFAICCTRRSTAQRSYFLRGRQDHT